MPRIDRFGRLDRFRGLGHGVYTLLFFSAELIYKRHMMCAWLYCILCRTVQCMLNWCCRSAKQWSHRSNRDRSQRHGSQHSVCSPVHGTGRCPDSKLDMVHRESPATSPRTRHVISPSISSRTRHGIAYRSWSPDEYQKTMDMVQWTTGSDYDTPQQQHAVSSSMVQLPLFLT